MVRHRFFSPGEWRLAKAAVQVLQIPLKVTKMWEGEKYPTINLVVSELYGMKQRLLDLSTSSCRFTSQFTRELLLKIENRFPNCNYAAFNFIPTIANYIDPAFKVVHIEALGVMEVTKDKILQRWKYLESSQVDEENNQGEGNMGNDDLTVETETFEDPTLKLLKARKVAGETGTGSVG